MRLYISTEVRKERKEPRPKKLDKAEKKKDSTTNKPEKNKDSQFQD